MANDADYSAGQANMFEFHWKKTEESSSSSGII